MKGGILQLFVLFFLLFGFSCAYGEEVIAFGDSITKGGIDSKGSDAGGYPLVLQQMYDNQNLPIVVVNSGVPGERTVEGVRRIGRHLGGQGYILIQEGNNDVIFGFSPQTIVQNLAYMVDKAKTTATVPLLATLTPDSRHASSDYINVYVNPLIRALAAEKEVTLVDTYAAVIDCWDTCSWDGLHPNYDGMYALAEAWKAVITIRLEPEPEEETEPGVVEDDVDGEDGTEGVSGDTQNTDDFDFRLNEATAKEGDGKEDEDDGGGCFIATAAFGSYIEPQVVVLRHFRDQILAESSGGRWFIAFYYKYSPSVAEYISQNEKLRLLVRLCLYPLIVAAYLVLNLGMFILVGLGCMSAVMLALTVKSRCRHRPVRP